MGWTRRYARELMEKEGRNPEQLRKQYELERKLADELRNASREVRIELYPLVYNKLFELTPHHPQLLRKSDPSARKLHIRNQIRILRHFLKPNSTFVEIGAGDCSLTLEAAKFAAYVFAIEISQVIAKTENAPPNFKLVLLRGLNIPLPAGSVNVAYSNQLIEHLHPDDALEQTKSIYYILAERGIYICITPNRLNGPHDISKFFEENAKGLHLREYSSRELSRLLRDAGFRKVQSLYLFRGKVFLLPLCFVKLLETLLDFFPAPIMKKIAHGRLLKFVLGIKLVARK